MAKRKRGSKKRSGGKVSSSVHYPIHQERVKLVNKNLLLFSILFFVSVAVGLISSNEIVDQVFWILAILFAFVGVALLIVLLTVWFMRAVRR